MTAQRSSSPAPSGLDEVRFVSSIRYHDRASKARYVWEKYRSLLEGRRVLDVGADACHLREQLDSAAEYWGIGWGPGVDLDIDLEQGRLDFEDRSFDCVVCCDVLEHLEAAHRVFDELCRVAAQSVIISLPNPWAAFWQQLRQGTSRGALKFYGMPEQPPRDRHRWFFSATQASRFIEERARYGGLKVAQLDFGWPTDRRWQRRMWRRRCLQRLRLLPQVELIDLYAGHVWAALERPGSEGAAA